MPTVEVVVSVIGNSRVVSKLNLTKGYYQVLVDESDREKTAFVYEKFEFVRTPLGYGMRQQFSNDKWRQCFVSVVSLVRHT